MTTTGANDVDETQSAEFIEADDRWRAAEVAVGEARGAALETIDTLSLLAPTNVTRQARACLDAALDAQQAPPYSEIRAALIAVCRVDLHVDDAFTPQPPDPDVPRPSRH